MSGESSNRAQNGRDVSAETLFAVSARLQAAIFTGSEIPGALLLSEYPDTREAGYGRSDDE